MEIYLSNTWVGKAIYLPKSKRVICPRVDSGRGTLTLNFFPETKQDLITSLKYRINNPDDNESVNYFDGMSLREFKPLPVKHKRLSKREQKKLSELIMIMRATPETDFHETSRIDSEKNLEATIRELGNRTEVLQCLQNYNAFYQNIFTLASWIGNSEQAEKWYKRKARG